MKRIAVIEDDPKRVKALRRQVIGRAEVMHASTAEGFVELLSREPAFDLVIFDHDLGGHQMVASGPGTGFEAAQRVPIKGDPLFLVWSFNPEGAMRIATLLYSRISGPRAPFPGVSRERIFVYPFDTLQCWHVIEAYL